MTQRDREILFAVGRMGQATTAQLRRLFFGDPSTASRRLAKLAALRLLDVHVTSLAEPNVYSLGAKGAALLVDGGADRAEIHRSRVGANADRHLRALNDLRVEFVIAARSRSDVEIVSFLSDLDLRRAAGSSPPPYIPDALVELRLPRGRLVLAAEIDTGTEGLSVFSSKAEHTVALWRARRRCWGAEPDGWRPAAFAPSATRVRALSRAIVSAGGGALWLVAELDRVKQAGAFGSVFETAEHVASIHPRAPIDYRGALARQEKAR